MKKAPPVRFSLRKLLIAMLATGPLAILPSPVLAALPTTLTTNTSATTPNTVIQTNGTGSLSSAGASARLTVSDKSILYWTPGSFNIAAGETYEFVVPNGSVLNKVGYNAATTAPGTADTATIAGALQSSGKVFILANGDIMIAPGARIETTNGLVLSTLNDTDVDGNFRFVGNLTYTGASQGNISIGSTAVVGAAVANVVGGGLTAYSGNISFSNISVGGDVILNQSKSASGLELQIGPTAPVELRQGSLTITTNNGNVVGNSSLTVNGTATFNVGSGTAALDTATASNDFKGAVSVNGANASLQDANTISLGTSNITGNLAVRAGSNITTAGVVAVGRNVTLTTSGGDIVFASNSTVGGTLNATTGGGNVTANTVGNLAVGNIFTGGATTLTLNLSSGGTGYTSAPTVVFTGGGGAGASATATINTSTGQVTGLTIVSSGAGYTSAPVISFAGGGANPTTAASGVAVLVAPINTTTLTIGAGISNGGAGYAAAPAVSFSTQTGATAPTATASITNGVVTSITITAAGSGYTSAPSVTIDAPGTGAGSAAAAASVALAPSALTSVNVTSGGAGYTIAPTVTFSAVGTGSGATATANLTGSAVTTVTTAPGIMVSGGANYTAAPTVTFSGGGTNPTTAATASNILSVAGAGNVSIRTNATANITGTISPVRNVTVVAGAVAAGTAGAIGNSTGGANAVTITSSGDATLPAITANTVTIGANGTVSQAGTTVLSIGNSTVNGTLSVNSTGNITLTNNNIISGVAPANTTVPANSLVTLTGNNISLTNTNNLTIGSVDAAGSLTINTAPSPFGLGTVTLGKGAGTAAPTIRVGGNLAISTNGSNVRDDVAANETILGTISVNTIAAGYGAIGLAPLTSSVGGFRAAPTITVSGSVTGSNATAATFTTGFSSTNAATLGSVVGFFVTNAGGGFTGVPTVTVAGGGAPTTSAVATITMASTGGSGSVVGDIAVTSGAGYTGTPRVLIGTAPAGGTNATATAIVDTATGVVRAINITNPGSGYTSTPSITLVGGGDVGQPSIPLTASIIPAGDVSFTAASNQGSASYGQFANINAGTLTVGERLTVNLGTINTQSLNVNSLAGDVLINGPITIYNQNTAAFRAGSGNITQGSSGVINNLGGSVTLFTTNTAGYGANLSNSSNVWSNMTVTNGAVNNIVLSSGVVLDRLSLGGANNTFNLTTPGTVIVVAGNYNGTTTINSGDQIFLTSNNATNQISARNLNLNTTSTGASSIAQTSAAASQIMNINGTLTLSTPGGVSLGGANNPSLGNVVLNNLTNATATITLTSRGNISSVSGSAAGTVNITAGAVGPNSTPGTYSITLGNLTAGNLILSAQNGGYAGQAANDPNNGASGDIRQAAGTSIGVQNTLRAYTFNGGNIMLNSANNAAGRVQLATGGRDSEGATTNNSGSITYTEGSWIRLGNLNTAGNATITSHFGTIFEDPGLDDVFTVGGTLSLSAPAGSVTIGNNTHTAGATTGTINAVTVNASGGVSLFSGGAISLGSIVGSSLQVTAAGNITQSAALGIFGLSTFNSTGGHISLTNENNAFGPLSLTVGLNRNIAVTEGSTFNLRSVVMPAGGNGTFTATSMQGDIIDTGFVGVRIGGSSTGYGTGVITLNAVNGNIQLNDATTEFNSSGGVVFNARDVELGVLGATAAGAATTLFLGAAGQTSTASGNLKVTSGLGSIRGAGAIRAGGTATFEAYSVGAGAGSIEIADGGFGVLKFTGRTVNISEAGDMVIATGSESIGAAALRSVNGSISIQNVGGVVRFGSTVDLSAGQNITLPKLVQAAGLIRLAHTGTANLSALSVSGDLNGINPLSAGPGTYVPPGQ